MRKVVISLLTAASILLTTATIDAKASEPVGQASVQTDLVTKVSSAKATAKSGSFKLNIIRMSARMQEQRIKLLLLRKKVRQQLRLTRKKLGKKLGIKLMLAGNQVGF